MKVSFRRDVLLRLLELARGPIKKIPEANASSHILIEVDGGLARVTSVGTLEWMTFMVPTDAFDGKMSLVLPQRLIEAIREVGRQDKSAKKAKTEPPDRVVFDDARGGLSMKVGSFTTKLTGQIFVDQLQDLAADRRAARTYGNPVTIAAPPLLRAIDEVLYASSMSQEPDLQGINLYRDGSFLAVVATDKSSYGRVTTEIQVPDDFNGFLISDVSLGPVREVLDGASELVLRQGESGVMISVSTPGAEDKLELYLEVIRPSPLRLVPVGEFAAFNIEKAEILNALSIATALGPKEITLIVTKDGSRFVAHDSLAQESDVEVKIPWAGEPFSSRFGTARLRRALTEPAGSTLNLAFSEYRLRVSGANSDHYLAFLRPK